MATAPIRRRAVALGVRLSARRGAASSTSWRARWLVALAIYGLVTVVYLACASPDVLDGHTRYNHFALQAEAWLRGRWDLGGPPPAYAGNNDFASYGGRWFVVFPPLPSLILLPFVAIAGSASAVADGLVFVLLAGLGPAVLFVALERLSREGSQRSVGENVALSLLFAFGTVYFFTAVQGTVWFGAHVVGVVFLAVYLYCATGAERPLWAGFALACALLARPPLAFAALYFASELRRVARARQAHRGDHGAIARAHVAKGLALFSLPIGAALLVFSAYNHARFGSFFDAGYGHLDIAWGSRIGRWGLFGYHYLARNLGILLTSLPWLPRGEGPPVIINGHGLALWFTSPFYLWLLWPRRCGGRHIALWLSVLLVALPTLLYQNSGWLQFGYRFSNDYAILLIALLALGRRRLTGAFSVAMAWALLVNAFGALTFERPAWSEYYYVDPSQRVLYQPD